MCAASLARARALALGVFFISLFVLCVHRDGKTKQACKRHVNDRIRHQPIPHTRTLSQRHVKDRIRHFRRFSFRPYPFPKTCERPSLPPLLVSPVPVVVVFSLPLLPPTVAVATVPMPVTLALALVLALALAVRPVLPMMVGVIVRVLPVLVGVGVMVRDRHGARGPRLRKRER